MSEPQKQDPQEPEGLALCWYCNGTGDIVVSTLEIVGKTLVFKQDCRTCKGAGVVPKSKEVPAA
jgi:DnaJ-class molecular chaperone